MLLDIDVLEQTRLEIQSQLDAAKTQLERNKLGQFGTPTALATDVLAYAKLLLPPDIPVRFLDPALGTGSFYSALVRVFTQSHIAQAVGYEIDPYYGAEAVRLWHDTPLTVHLEDFTQADFPQLDDDKFNLIICNPPYVRHHHLSSSDKLRLKRQVKQSTGIALNGLGGLYGYFLCLSAAWLAEEGIAGWLIPSEFMDVNYGRQLKDFLLRQVMLLRIHRFDPLDGQFEDALVSSAVVWFKKTPPLQPYTVEFTYGGTLTNPSHSEFISSDRLSDEPKWTRFPLYSHRAAVGHNTPKLADLFTIKRGIATGANEFFILTPDQAVQHQIPNRFLTPILPSPRYLTCDEVLADEMGQPILDQRLLLLTCDLPELQLRTEYPTVWRYLHSGMERGLHQGYLCLHRSPWYRQEQRPAAPFLCTYMGRSYPGSRPFRFILNHSLAVAPNVYLNLYPKQPLQVVLQNRPELKTTLWRVLNEIPLEELIGEGRVYGGGLHKIEPRELGNASAEQIMALVPELKRKIDHFEQKRLFK